MNTRVKNKVPQRQVSEKIDVYDWTSTAKVYGDIFKAQQAHHRDLEKQRAESELERTRARFPELFK
jgi:hypothetical protein